PRSYTGDALPPSPRFRLASTASCGPRSTRGVCPEGRLSPVKWRQMWIKGLHGRGAGLHCEPMSIRTLAQALAMTLVAAGTALVAAGGAPQSAGVANAR